MSTGLNRVVFVRKLPEVYAHVYAAFSGFTTVW